MERSPPVSDCDAVRPPPAAARHATVCVHSGSGPAGWRRRSRPPRTSRPPARWCSPARGRCRATRRRDQNLHRLARDAADRIAAGAGWCGSRSARPAGGCRRSRSRSGGTRSATTLMRWNRSSRKRPAATSPSRSRAVAATSRTSIGRSSASPSRRTRSSCRTRNSFTCSSSGSSAISSRKSVPPTPAPAARRGRGARR